MSKSKELAKLGHPLYLWLSVGQGTAAVQMAESAVVSPSPVHCGALEQAKSHQAE